MANDSTGERTEKPSAKKLREARPQGNVPRSADLVAAFSLLAATVALAKTGGASVVRLQAYLADGLRHLGDRAHATVTPDTLAVMAQHDGMLLALVVGPVMATAAITGLAGNLVQSGWVFAPNKLTPDFTKLSLVTGFGRFAPSLNLLAVAPPIRVAVGLVAMAAMVPFAPPIIRAASSGLGELALRAVSAFR